MAMTMKLEGADELGIILEALGNKAESVAKQSLYEGARIMADGYAKAAESIRTEPFRGKKDMRLPSPLEKTAVVGRTGIARFNATGSEVDTVIGIEADGYVMIWNRKKAVRLIARSINSGTSFMKKQPVFRKAKTTFTQSASQAIVDKAEQLYDEIINGSGK